MPNGAGHVFDDSEHGNLEGGEHLDSLPSLGGGNPRRLRHNQSPGELDRLC